MKLYRVLPALTLLAALVGAGATVALAAEPAASAPVADACRRDVETLCAGIAPGEGRIAACMKQHRAKLSGDCKAALKNQRGQRRAPPAQ